MTTKKGLRPTRIDTCPDIYNWDKSFQTQFNVETYKKEQLGTDPVVMLFIVYENGLPTYYTVVQLDNNKVAVFKGEGRITDATALGQVIRKKFYSAQEEQKKIETEEEEDPKYDKEMNISIDTNKAMPIVVAISGGIFGYVLANYYGEKHEQ